MLINIEEFRNNFYGVLQIANREDEEIIIKSMYGEVSLISSKLLNKLKGKQYKRNIWDMMFW